MKPDYEKALAESLAREKHLEFMVKRLKEEKQSNRAVARKIHRADKAEIKRLLQKLKQWEAYR